MGPKVLPQNKLYQVSNDLTILGSVRLYGKIIESKEKGNILRISLCNKYDKSLKDIIDYIDHNYTIDDYNLYNNNSILRFRTNKTTKITDSVESLVGKYVHVTIRPESIYVGNKKSVNWLCEEIVVDAIGIKNI